MPMKAKNRQSMVNKAIYGERKGPAPKRRRISRAEREAAKKRRLYLALSIAGIAVLMILAGTLANQYIIKPRAVLAEVNGVDIRRQDYWKYRSYDLMNQISTYNQYAQFVDASQAQQYQQLAQQAQLELQDVWGSTSVDDGTLARMIDDQVYLQGMDDLGLTVTDEDVTAYLDQLFAPAGIEFETATPTETLIPLRAEWATQTAVAAAATPIPASPEAASPEAASPIAASAETASSPVAASPGVASPAAASMEAASPTMAEAVVASPEVASPSAATPEAASPESASPAASPAAAFPEVSATLTGDEARSTAQADFSSFEDTILPSAHMSRSDFVRLIARPQIARQQVAAALDVTVGQTAEQVQASHILVATKDLADELYIQLTEDGADFAELAKKESTDEGTKANGGDLGWFTRGAMVPEFDEAAFSLPAGEISQPVKTQYGYHVIKVNGHEMDRAMTDEQISRQKESVVTAWLEGQREKMRIASPIKPTPTPEAEEFVPPPDAPTPPMASPAASPEASPVASPIAIASPAA